MRYQYTLLYPESVSGPGGSTTACKMGGGGFFTGAGGTHGGVFKEKGVGVKIATFGVSSGTAAFPRCHQNSKSWQKLS